MATTGIPAIPGADPPRVARLAGRRRWLYAALWLLLGFALGLAEYQDPKLAAGRRPWEPFFLEMGSVAVVGALAVLVYRGVAFLERAGWSPARQALAHLAGAVAFTLVHVAATYALRFAVYAALDHEYRTRSWTEVLAYEGPKDLVTYLFVAGIAYAFCLRRRQAEHREQIARARSELAELRLARLGDQLQPHFLFNCLNSIAALVEENPSAAVSMIARVGDFLRSTLQADGPTAPLRAELALLEDFLAIQAVRFEDSIHVTSSVDPAAECVPVPRLLLQPLVENAVKHNMVRPDRPLELRIEVRKVDGRVRISIANSLAGGGARDADGAGLGLEHVRRRLDLHYAGRARLCVEASDGWFTVVVEVPATMPDEPAR